MAAQGSTALFTPRLPLLRPTDLLLSQGQVQEVLHRSEQTLYWWKKVFKNPSPLTLSLELLTFGRGRLQRALQNQIRDFATAETHFNQAADGLRQAGQQDDLPRGLLARAELHRVARDFAKAQRDLDEAFTIATRGGMRLHEADCHLEYARLHLAIGEKGKALESWGKAKKVINEMGYHRRDPEIHLIQAQLALASGEKDAARENLVKANELIDKMGMHRWDIEVKEIEEQLGQKILTNKSFWALRFLRGQVLQHVTNLVKYFRVDSPKGFDHDRLR